jgi:ATP-dependent protease ClpP protease subunit
MSKELYLYAPMYPFVIEGLMAQLEENKGKKVTLRAYTPGGSVRASWGLFSKIKEHGMVDLRVDGGADSMGSFLPLYCNSSTCLNVSKLVMHRADMLVESPEDQKFLDDINNDLKAQMLKKIDALKWKQVTGITIEELFDPTTRKDYVITGKQAVEIGLIDELKELTPQIQEEIEAYNTKFHQVAAIATPNSQLENPHKMNLTKLKAEHPDVYALAVAEGVAKAKATAKDWLAFVKDDPEGVAKGIESGEAITVSQAIEFVAKRQNATALSSIEGENAESVKTAAEKETGKSAEAKQKEKDAKAFNDKLEEEIKRFNHK